MPGDHPVRRLAELDGYALQLVLRSVDEGLDQLSDLEAQVLVDEGLVEWNRSSPQWSPDGWDLAQLTRSNAA